ncbi:MAG TPA: hypothetical protein ENJ54_05490 [Chloroflexi bacterium]|nr:hypothetical protein [Chloroflexota bacterium]
MNRRRPWFLLTGLLLGLGVGLFLAWVVFPVRYTETAPDTLRPDFKEAYRALIARAYAYDHNLPRARARLRLLGESQPAEALAAQAQRALAAGRPPAEVHALGELAAALGQAPGARLPVTASLAVGTASASATAPPAATPTLVAMASPTRGATPSPVPSGFPTLPPTPTPLPTRTPQPVSTAGAPLVLRALKPYCDPDGGPLLRIFVRDAAGNPLPGVEINIHWLGGDERIYTGLKPDVDLGYADFLMVQDEVYQVRPAYGVAVTDLRPRECQTDEGSRFWGGWTLTFVQP